MLNNGWFFSLLPVGSCPGDTATAQWQPVTLPHDWQIGDTSDLYRDGDGWYRRSLSLTQEDLSGHVMLDFDGVYMDSELFLNGKSIARHPYGYTPFLVDLTPWAQTGENSLLLRVRYQSPNSRWYSGAGIFRNVRLLCLPETCLLPFSVATGTCRQSDGLWTLEGEAECLGPDSGAEGTAALLQDGEILAQTRVCVQRGRIPFAFTDLLVRPWMPDAPACYTLRLSLNGQVLDTTVGFRTLRLDPQTGLWVNDRPVKLHGVCLHHDLGCLGAAFHPEAFERQLRALMDIGVNALRTSHNPPAREALEICDRLGIMVADEAFDMWEMPKTAYDYARFFPHHALADLQAYIRRDRNHPCVFFWSIGNEIPDTHHSPTAPNLTRALRDAARQADPFGHAFVTIGSNYMPWAGAQSCADELKVPGYNYGEHLYLEQHAAHPDWVIYGSETASIVSSRGIYHFPMEQNILCDEDQQCSSLGNSHTSWGHQDLRRMLGEDLATPYSMGQFVWSGTDYIGEPTPYHTRNSYFGIFDTCCFPKDSAYLYRAFWTEAPFVHIGVHWDWNPGQLIDVPVMTMLPEVELFLGDTSLGRKAVRLSDPEQAVPVWQVPYAPLPLKAIGYDEQGQAVAEALRQPCTDPVRLCLDREKTPDGHLAFLDVSAVDREGRPVENAVDLVSASVTGPARILGMDNGDSVDPEGYVVTQKRLFSGRLLLVLQALSDSGEAVVTVQAPGLTPATLTLPLGPAFHGEPAEDTLVYEKVRDDTVHVRKLLLAPLSDTHLSPEHPAVRFRVQAVPPIQKPDIRWRVTNRAGIDSPCASVQEKDAGEIQVTGCGDGELYLRGTVFEQGVARLISQYELHLTGFGSPCLDPYGFIAGGLYDEAVGDIGPGNEHGFAFARDGVSAAVFHNLDFGKAGSDRITIPIFALEGEPHRIRLLRDSCEGECIAELFYQKPSIWNVYQAETWQLPCVLTGIQTLVFQSSDKIHVKGFSFEKQSRAFRLLTGTDADEVFGDDFERAGREIRRIGNNVSITFRDLDFGGAESCTLALSGSTDLEIQPVTVKIQNRETSVQTLCEFRQGDCVTQTFPVQVLPGCCDVTLIFLPGSRFDFAGLRFTPD